jgi:hypothetical protein
MNVKSLGFVLAAGVGSLCFSPGAFAIGTGTNLPLGLGTVLVSVRPPADPFLAQVDVIVTNCPVPIPAIRIRVRSLDGAGHASSLPGLEAANGVISPLK